MAFDHNDIEIIKKEAVFKGYFRMDRYRLTHKLFDGGRSPELVREVLERGKIAAVVPYDPMRNEVILIEQFRPGAMAAGWEPWQTEIIAGVIEEGETAEAMAFRETQEECGCEASTLLHLGSYLSSPGCSSETVDVFCGRVDTSNAGGIHGAPHEGEDILVRSIPVDEAFQILESGKIKNSMTLIALQWFRNQLANINAAWLP